MFDENVLKKLKTLYLGKKVNTKYGEGIIVEISMPVNGLYISPEKTMVVVWYPEFNRNTFVTMMFSFEDLI